jgi:hypothetical protein
MRFFSIPSRSLFGLPGSRMSLPFLAIMDTTWTPRLIALLEHQLDTEAGSPGIPRQLQFSVNFEF